MPEKSIKKLKEEIERLELEKRKAYLEREIKRKLEALKYEAANPIKGRIRRGLGNYLRNVALNYKYNNAQGLTPAQIEIIRRLEENREKRRLEAIA